MPISRRSLIGSLLLASGLLLTPSLDAQGTRRPQRGGRPSEAGERTLEHGGRQRTYVVRAPRDRGETPRPVVIMLHGGGGNAANAERMSGFTGLVERERLIVVYPNGTSRRGDRLLTWNAGHCCGFAMEHAVDDVGFIDAMLDALAREYRIDERRIYVTGMSNGAMMTHRLGRELRHRPAAIAPVVGAVFGDEAAPASPVAAVIFNGLKDTSVPANGGLGNGVGQRAWDGVPPRPNVDQGTYWARAAGCAQTPQSTEDAGVIHWTWPCASGAAVQLYQLKDHGHAWPGGQPGSRRGDRPSDAIDATEVMWAFFKARTSQQR